jgi:hypothetical protein
MKSESEKCHNSQTSPSQNPKKKYPIFPPKKKKRRKFQRTQENEGKNFHQSENFLEK